MPETYKGYTVPVDTDVADAPKAFADFADSIPFSQYIEVVEVNSATRTVEDADNGKLLFVKTDCTLTFPSLTEGFSAAIVADAGVTVTYTGTFPDNITSSEWELTSCLATSGNNLLSVASGDADCPECPDCPESELIGIGGWATIESVTGNPTRYEYPAGNPEWVAFEWTQDGKITTSGGLVETLICGGGGQGSGGWVSPGAYLLSGVEEISAGQLNVHIGAAATADNTNGGASWVGNSAPYDLFANGGSGTAGPDSGPGQGPYGSYPSSITGTERFFCAYGDSWADSKYKEPGQGGRFDQGALQQPGVVIVRVPVEYDDTKGQGSTPASVVAAVDQAKETVKQTIKRNRRKK